MFEQHVGTVNQFTSNVNPFTESWGNVAYMKMGERIRARRKELKLTQQQVADAIGGTRETVTMWETGKVTYISGKYLTPLTELFKQSADMIQYGKESAKKRLTVPGSTAPASQELLAHRREGDIDALTVIVSAVAGALTRSIPAVGREAKSLLESLPDFESGRYAEILKVLNEALGISEAERPIAPPRGVSSRGGKIAK